MSTAIQILITVLTALATTVVVEYVARPRLDARKARLIGVRQRIDDLMYAYVRLINAGSSVPSAVGAHPEWHHQAILKLEPPREGLLTALGALSPRYTSKHEAHVALVYGLLGRIFSVIEGE